MFPREPDRFFVQLLGVEETPLYAGDLGADQRRTGPEILRAVIGPDLKLPMMCSQRLQMRRTLLGTHRVAVRRPRERCVKVVFRDLEERWRGPQEPLRL